MKVAFNVPASRACITAALEGLTALNALMIARRDLPSLYASGIRYVREQPGGPDEWQNAEELIRSKEGDCEDLAAYRAGELRVAGVPARAVAIRTGPTRFHAIVLYPDGTREDPSLQLGMRRRR